MSRRQLTTRRIATSLPTGGIHGDEAPDPLGTTDLVSANSPAANREHGRRGGSAGHWRRHTKHPFAAFVARRLAAGLATLFVASLLIFLATTALPGNVAQVVLGKNATPAAVSALESKLHLHESLFAQYGQWLGGVLHGDLGQSAVALAEGTQQSVTSLIGTPLRNSLVLALATTLLLIPMSLLLGTLAAVRAGRATDYAVSYTGLVLGALPEFVLGTILILIFFVGLNLLPPLALVPPGSSPLAHPQDLILPVLTLLGVSLAFSARQVRAGVMQALRQDFVRMARLSGLPERRVIWRYAVRNALAPSVQSFAQSLQYLFGGIIVVETLFGYPGIGQALVQAVSVRDVSVVQGIALVIAAIYILINIVADITVVFLVPKLRSGLQ